METIEQNELNGLKNSGNNLNIRIQLFKETNPFIYIQNDLDTKRYRISTNYEYLNSKYDLKIQFLRNFNKLNRLPDIKISEDILEWFIYDNQQSVYFNIDFIKKYIPNYELEESEFKYNSNGIWNILKIYKYIHGDYDTKTRTCILIFNKKFGNESDYSMFFASEQYPNIEEFLRNR